MAGKPARKDEISAGLLAYRRAGQVEFLLAHPGGPYWARKDDGAWTIPKGLVRPDDLLTGALREFREETGLTAQGPFVPLAKVRQRSGKTVHAFAFEADLDLTNFASNMFDMEWPPRSGRRQQFPEIEPDRVVSCGRGDEEDHRLSAAFFGRAAGEARRRSGRAQREPKSITLALISPSFRGASVAREPGIQSGIAARGSGFRVRAARVPE